jgi:glycosyltransferase involved in cell wall biosynthesis
MKPPKSLNPRVLWLTDEFPPEFGGTGAMAYQLSQGLAAQGLSVEVVSRQIVPPAPKREHFGKVPVQRIRPAGRLKGAGWRAVPLLLAYLMRLAALLVSRARRFDVVIISGIKIIPLAAVPVCRLLGKQCVIRVESPFEILEPVSSESLTAMNSPAARWLTRILAQMQGAVLRRAQIVVAISAEIEALLKRYPLAQGQLTRIPNTADLAAFKPVTADEQTDLRRKLGIPLARTVVVNVGRITYSKGMMTLINAWPAVVQRNPDVLLVVVGSGKGYWDDCEDELIEYVRANQLQDHVLLVGQSDRAREYFQAADLFVSPSEYEGFALTLIEALGCGLPTVTTSVGEAPLIIREGVNGFLCAPRAKDELISKIDMALKQRAQWPEMRRSARESVLDFDIARVSAQYAGLCRELRA